MASTDMGHNGPGDGGAGPSDVTRANEPDGRQNRTARVGLVLVVIGALALLSNLGVLRGVHDVVAMVIFAVLGGFALNHYLTRRRVGSLIGAFVLFALAAATVGGAASGFYFLALVGVGFAAVYFVDRARWWAIIPAGTLFTLAIIAGLDSWAPGYDAGWVFFAGLAATFAALYRLPGDPKAWAVYPAVASVVLALLTVSVGGVWLVPLVLVALGVYLLVRDRGSAPRVEAASEAQGPERATGEAEDARRE